MLAIWYATWERDSRDAGTQDRSRERVTESTATRARQFRREMAPPERVLWAKLRRNQLQGFHFRRRQIIDDFIADFYCHATGLVIEVDGPIHHQQVEYDAERDRILAAHNLQTLRFPNGAVMHDLPHVLDQITAALHAPDRPAAPL